jgi:hypothetical protein
MIVWGILGMGINMAMIIFSKGTPMFMEYMGMTNAVQSFIADEFTMNKLWVALAVSIAMNTIFAPVFMTFHKITDAHIAENGGSLKALITPIPMARRFSELNWRHNGGSYSKKQFHFFGTRLTPLHSYFPRNNVYFLQLF